MCTVLLRFDPGSPWPVLLGAIRDEYLGRAWDPPASHWPGLLGGRDRVSGGTWLAVDPAGPAVAAVLNGVRRPALPGGKARPTRGRLPLAALSTRDLDPARVPGAADLDGYDGFHLLRADPTRADVWSWDGLGLAHTALAPGDHILVNLGPDRDEDPLVPHFRPLLSALPVPPLTAGTDTGTAWAGWAGLLRGDGLDPTDPRALVIAHDVGGHRYGSSSATLVGLGRSGRVRYDFTATPEAPAWTVVLSDPP